MKIIFKILRILVYILIGVLLLAIYSYYNDGKLGKGDYFIYYSGTNALKSFENKELYIADIISSDYDDKYIILCRVPLKSYVCNNKDYQKYINKLQYLIVIKETNKIYATYDYKKFVDKLKEIASSLFFGKKDLQEINRLFTKNRHIYNNEELPPTNCKEENTATLLNIKYF